MRAGLSLKLPSLTFVSGPVLTLLLDGAKKSSMHFRPPSVRVPVAVVILETCQQYLGRTILKILVKKTLIEISLSGIVHPNGN
jgi:hypothetical protein